MVTDAADFPSGRRVRWKAGGDEASLWTIASVPVVAIRVIVAEFLVYFFGYLGALNGVIELLREGRDR